MINPADVFISQSTRQFHHLEGIFKELTRASEGKTSESGEGVGVCEGGLVSSGPDRGDRKPIVNVSILSNVAKQVVITSGKL